MFAAQSNERQEITLRNLIYNSDLGPLLQIINTEGFGQASAERYLHDFVHMVYKPTAENENEVFYNSYLTQTDVPLRINVSLVYQVRFLKLMKKGWWIKTVRSMNNSLFHGHELNFHCPLS